MPYSDIGGKKQERISDAEKMRGSIFDTWSDALMRMIGGDPMGGMANVSGGISPRAVMRAPQRTAEGNLLPSVRELYENIPMQGQPKTLRTPVPMRPRSKTAGQALSEPNLEIGSAMNRVGKETSESQLMRLQHFLTSLFQTQSRQ